MSWRLVLPTVAVLSAVLLSMLSVRASESSWPTGNKIDWTNASEEFLALQWAQFKLRYEKVYANVDEDTQRYKIFKENMARAGVLNSENPHAAFGVTPFVDLAPAEFSRLYKGYRPPDPIGADIGDAMELELAGTVRSEHIKTAPDPRRTPAAPDVDVDWRGKAVSAVKDQKRCGSCWAFSAVETIESAYFMKYGFDENFALSPQQLVDCDSTDFGCGGGWPSSAFDYVHKEGLETETAYPYKGREGRCSYQAASVAANVSGWAYATPRCLQNDSCPYQDEGTLLNNLVSLGPSSICVCSEPWVSYIGGILTSGCANGLEAIDHAVELVGYNHTQGGYWIVRNSWGARWGVGGYIYIAYGNNTCGVANVATIPYIV